MMRTYGKHMLQTSNGWKGFQMLSIDVNESLKIFCIRLGVNTLDKVKKLSVRIKWKFH